MDISTGWPSLISTHGYIHGYIHGYPYPRQPWLLATSRRCTVLHLIEWPLVVELCLPRLVAGVSVSFPVDSLEPPSSPLHLMALTIVPRWLWTLTDDDWPQWDLLVDELTQNTVVASEQIVDVVRRISEQVRQRQVVSETVNVQLTPDKGQICSRFWLPYLQITWYDST